MYTKRDCTRPGDEMREGCYSRRAEWLRSLFRQSLAGEGGSV